MSKIISIATNVPAYKHDQNEICQFADKIYNANVDESRKYRYLYNHSGIKTRYSIVPDYTLPAAERSFFPTTENLEPFPDMDKRMQWYAAHATPLSIKTIEECIAGKINKNEITHLITVSCTGLSAPGLDLDIMETMELPKGIFRTSVNFMGCYAAIHAFKLADALCKSSQNANVVVVCTELCTLHFQKENTIDNITATILFGDGCAAVLMQSNPVEKGISFDSFFSQVAFKGKPDMAWTLSAKGFLMTLTGYVPELVQEDFESLFSAALKNSSLNKEAITHWCFHPGGKKILEAIEKSIALPADSLHHSYKILSNYGNMSSSTIVFVLQDIFNHIKNDVEQKPAKIFGAAFGPGLTMETFIASYD
ncbi:MAG: type III polyketide synthase [Ferruginibacter sp.]|nr:type III polyketide synthase [Ferruginibacter sp.]